MLKMNRQHYGFIGLVTLGLITGCNAQVQPKQNSATLESKSTLHKIYNAIKYSQLQILMSRGHWQSYQMDVY